ncbi:MAG: ImmA/IrrE family metallo-endopeptidase [Betaproteobacteria bacterium]
MRIPTLPRERYCLGKARSFIVEEGIRWLPINPFEIAERHGWGPVSVGSLAKSTGLKRHQIINGKDGDVICVDGHCKIVFNELVHSPDRIRWTITHEIGHIVLGHLLDFDKTRLSRGGLSDHEYRVLEREADLFAAEVLAPMAVLKAIGALKCDEIIRVCHLSREAAAHREKDIAWRGCRRIYCDADELLETWFRLYLAPVAVCMNPDELPIKSVIRRNPEVPVMNEKLAFVPTDEDGRFTRCPRCGNTRFSARARYCKLCGMYLYNDCTNVDHNSFSDWCGARNPGDARYCELCGAETVLLSQGLLMTWEELLQANRSVEDGLGASDIAERQVAATSTVNIDVDDDVPF